MPYDAIEFGPRPYMSLNAFQTFCRQHKVEFIWYFGPWGGSYQYTWSCAPANTSARHGLCFQPPPPGEAGRL